MPWHAARSSECPASKPWAVIKDADGTVEGCHANREAALAQVAALYAQEEKSALMQHKSVVVDITDANPEQGTFDALVAVFNNVDSGGDRIQPGAFTKSLERWRASGDPIPIILSHQHSDPYAHIGVADPNEVTQSDRGLHVHATLDVKDNDVAAQVHRLMKRRSLKEFSFGYKVPRGGEKRDKQTGVNDLIELDLIEIGPTLKGMNPETELHAVKSALEKAEWTTAYINDLPDSSFLYIEPGGSKDSDGKTTPRSLRHFPYKDASGKIDLPHLRNALSRIPQSGVPTSVKERLASRARTLLDNAKDEPPSEKAQRRELDEARLAELTEGLPDPAVLAKQSVAELNARVDELTSELKVVEELHRHPASESELRRADQEKRLAELDVPEVELEDADRLEQIQFELKAIKEVLAKKEPDPEPEPLSAAELRRRDAEERLKAVEVAPVEPGPSAAEELVEMVRAQGEQLNALCTEVAELKKEPEPPSEDELRRRDAEERLPTPKTEPGPSAAEELIALVREQSTQIEALKGALDDVRDDLESLSDPEQQPSDGTLRRRDAEERLKAATGGEPPKAEPPPDRLTELQGQIADLAGAVGGLQKALMEGRSEETPRETSSSQAALRKRSDEVVLEIASQGFAPHPPPTSRDVDDEGTIEIASEEALRRWSRDSMFTLLTGEEAG